jgi:hypothetical protein
MKKSFVLSIAFRSALACTRDQWGLDGRGLFAHFVGRCFPEFVPDRECLERKRPGREYYCYDLRSGYAGCEFLAPLAIPDFETPSPGENRWQAHSTQVAPKRARR